MRADIRNKSTMTHAKRGFAKCGHPGTFMTPSYVSCDRRCEMPGAQSDGIPVYVEPETTRPLCPDYTSLMGDCTGAGEIVKWDKEWRDALGREYWMCRGCGRSFHA